LFGEPFNLKLKCGRISSFLIDQKNTHIVCVTLKNYKFHIFDGTGSLLYKWKPRELSYNHKIILDDKGNIIIYDYEKEHIYIYDQNGELLYNDAYNLDDIASNGSLYMIHNNTVDKFNIIE